MFPIKSCTTLGLWCIWEIIQHGSPGESKNKNNSPAEGGLVDASAKITTDEGTGNNVNSHGTEEPKTSKLKRRDRPHQIHSSQSEMK